MAQDREDRIRKRAYQLWQQEGSPQGRPDDHWLQAEREIDHGNGVSTRYAHLSQIRVEVGQRVSRGDRIGDMGNSGRSTGTHLHYEVRIGGSAVNPVKFIKAASDVF